MDAFSLDDIMPDSLDSWGVFLQEGAWYVFGWDDDYVDTQDERCYQGDKELWQFNFVESTRCLYPDYLFYWYRSVRRLHTVMLEMRPMTSKGSLLRLWIRLEDRLDPSYTGAGSVECKRGNIMQWVSVPKFEFIEVKLLI